MSSQQPLFSTRDLGKEFAGPGETLVVLKCIDLDVLPGESLAILGASGSGKTTLLHLLGSLDTPSWGQVFFAGRDISALDATARAAVRNREIGFIFQFHHLLPEFNTLENVAMPGIIAGLSQAESERLALEALDHVDLGPRAHHTVTTLSGGERQRAAIARAILMKPKALLADEPTGSLDEQTGRKVGELLLRLNHELGMTLVVVTHNLELAGGLSRQLELHAGELYGKA